MIGQNTSNKDTYRIFQLCRRLFGEDVEKSFAFTEHALLQQMKPEESKEELELVIKHLTICSDCNTKATWHGDSTFIHGQNYGPVYYCKGCGNYVGCHKDSPRKPLGFPADKILRKLRLETHELFDPIWKKYDNVGRYQNQVRNLAYDVLAHELNVTIYDTCHIGYLSKDQCRKAKRMCKSGKLENILDATFRVLLANSELANRGIIKEIHKMTEMPDEKQFIQLMKVYLEQNTAYVKSRYIAPKMKSKARKKKGKKR